MKTLALYIRLSDEDDAVRSGERDESNSITAQRDLMYKYIKDHNEFDDYEVIEYFDDGVSGTKFRTRTQFQKMLEDAENGVFECLMVKDFSRLGRDYIEVGNLMEFTFPKIGLRFISVNDGYDSINNFGTYGGMDIAFKNLIYHLYSRDLSRKTKSALMSRKLNGEYVSPFVLYGYKRDPKRKNKLIIDEKSAKIIREIFDMALRGMNCHDISRELNRRKVPSVLAVQREKSNFNAASFLGKEIWYQASVHRILTNEAYTGKLIQGKTETQGFGDNRIFVKKSRDEWQIIDGGIPRIISDEVFEQIAKKYKSTDKVGAKLAKNNFFYCPNCGRKLKASGKTYICSTGIYDTESQCVSMRVSKKVIEGCVLSVAKSACKLVLDERALKEKMQTENEKNGKLTINAVESRIKKLNNQNTDLYEQFLMGKVSKDIYIERRKQTKDEISALEEQLAELKVQAEVSKPNDEYTGILNEIIQMDKFDKAFLSKIVDRVIVYDETHLSIEFKGNDVFQNLFEAVDCNLAQ